MRHIRTIFAALLLCAAPVQAQTIKAISYNTSNNIVIPPTTQTGFDFGALGIRANTAEVGTASGAVAFTTNGKITFYTTNSGFAFSAGASAAQLRNDLQIGATWLTNTNVTNFRTSIGLGETSDVKFREVGTDAFRSFEEVTEFYGPIWIGDSGQEDIFQFEIGSVDQAKARANLGLGATNEVQFARVVAGSDVTTNDIRFAVDTDGIEIEHYGSKSLISFVGGTNLQNKFRSDIGLGATNIVTFAGLTNNGDITINQTTATNGLLFIRRTNNEPFLGLANLIASNNTTISNETLFRVGVAEATNKAAQFGFRSTNTNGNGVAVFSVFGFNALMQIGADASTNAVIYSGGGTNNEVMTLIRNGATEFARPLRFSTNASTRPSTNAPANTTNVAAWVEMRIGTNSYRVPLYQ